MKKLQVVLLILLVASTAHAADYRVGQNNSSDTVYFNSPAKLEFIEGKTNDIEGSFSFEPDDSGSAVSGILKVDLRTLKTGIETRDEHMRDNHLHTDKYPFAYFELISVEGTQLLDAPDSNYTTIAKGKFYIHGKYREIEPELELIRKKSPSGVDLITVRARFSINLDKYKIPRPKALFLKLAETIEIEVVFTGSLSKSSYSIELPDWHKLD